MTKQRDPNKQIEELNKNIQKLTQRYAKSADDISESYEDAVDYAKELLNNLERQKDLEEGISNLKKQASDLTATALSFYREGNKEAAKELTLLAKSARFQVDKATETSNYLKLQAEELKDNGKLIKQKERLAKLEEEYRDKIRESLSFVDDITAKIEEIPIVGGLLSKMLGADELKTKLTDIATKEFAALKDGGTSTMSAITGSFKATIAAAGPLLPLILGIAAAVALIKFAVDIDKDITSLARNLGVSKENAKELHEEMVEVQRASDNAQMSIENQTKAMTSLASATGTNTALTKELVENQVLLANNLGIQEEAAAKLNRAFAAQGLDAQKTTLEVANTVEEINNATNAGLNQKEIFEDIAAVSKEIQLRYKGNFKQLTLQVVKAKQLGLTLDRIAEIGKTSLDIESSLTNEMQARILTGKAINLNAFRQASITGDMATQMEELQKNAGSFEEFQQMMNTAPYQADALATALGMTTAEVASMLEQKQLLEKIGVSELSKATEAQIKAANLGEEKEKELLAQLKIADTTEKLAKATNDIKNIFAGLATILQPVINAFVFIVEQVEAMRSILIGIGTYMATKFLMTLGLSTLQFIAQVKELGFIEALTLRRGAAETVLTTEKTIQAAADVTSATASKQDAIATTAGLGPQAADTAMAGTEAAAKVTGAIASTGGIGAAWIIPAILGSIAALGSFIFMDDGVMSPVGPAGYSRVLSGPEGSIALNDKDTLVAGTDLNQGGSGGNNGEVVALLKELIAKIDQPVHINIGNRAVTELEKQTTMTRRFKTSMEQGYGLHG